MTNTEHDVPTVEIAYIVTEQRTARVPLNVARDDDLENLLAQYEDAGDSTLHGLTRDVDTSTIPDEEY